jgi:hypothetical protein
VSNGATFDASGLTTGSHRIEARIDHATPDVRLAPPGLLAGSHTWDVVVRLGGPGRAPSNLQSTSTVGNTVTLAWTAPTALTPTDYVIEAGLAPGETIASLIVGGASTSVTVAAPTGVFYVRISARVGGILTEPSNEIRLAVNVPAPPSAPSNLLGGGNAAMLFLMWDGSSSPSPASEMYLDVSGAVQLTVPLPPSERFVFDGVPPGTYTFAVRAANAGGTSAPSNSATVTFPAPCVVPDTPVGLTAVVSGGTVVVTWSLPRAGAAPTDFVLTVGGAFVGNLAVQTRRLVAAPPPGTYVVAVMARNPCGSSAPTPPVTIGVP